LLPENASRAETLRSEIFTLQQKLNRHPGAPARPPYVRPRSPSPVHAVEVPMPDLEDNKEAEIIGPIVVSYIFVDCNSFNAVL
jgi:hypothetical protein